LPGARKKFASDNRRPGSGPQKKLQARGACRQQRRPAQARAASGAPGMKGMKAMKACQAKAQADQEAPRSAGRPGRKNAAPLIPRPARLRMAHRRTVRSKLNWLESRFL
jgi:hypothetical protein